MRKRVSLSILWRKNVDLACACWNRLRLELLQQRGICRRIISIYQFTLSWAVTHRFCILNYYFLRFSLYVLLIVTMLCLRWSYGYCSTRSTAGWWAGPESGVFFNIATYTRCHGVTKRCQISNRPKKDARRKKYGTKRFRFSSIVWSSAT